MNNFKQRYSFVLIGTIFFFIGACTTVLAQSENALPIYKDMSKPIAKRAQDLISRMTLEEKINLIVGDGRFLAVESTEGGKSKVLEANPNAKMLVPRLSIMKTTNINGPSGVNESPAPEGAKEYTYTTAFPSAPCLAATWNTEMVENVGKATGDEVLEYGYDLIKAPGLNLHRNPKCGRNFEYYSEDPLLSGTLAAFMVRGLQSNGIATTIKHFVANNQETNRRTYNAVISQRALREIYLRGFEIAVKEGHAAAIMTSYNRVNGYYTAENPELLKDIVRREWGFKGLFMTDFNGYGSAVAKVRAGSNMLMTGSMEEYNELRAAIKNKTLDESTLDENLVYNMQLKLNSPSMQGYIPSFKPDLKAHAKIAREAAGEGMVLLKNKNNTLPMNTEKTVALFGKISYHLIDSGTGSGTVRSNKYAISINEGLKSAGFKILKSMENFYIAYIEKLKRENIVPDYFNNPKMRKDNGIKGNQAPPHFKKRLVAFSKEKALSKAYIKKQESKSDIAVITLGRSAGENYENGWLPMTPIERDLVRNVSEIFHAAGKKVIVVLNVAGVWETASWRDYADAILLAWLPGQEGGHAVADILTGAVNPSGKLPDSFPLKTLFRSHTKTCRRQKISPAYRRKTRLIHSTKRAFMSAIATTTRSTFPRPTPLATACPTRLLNIRI